MIEISMAFESQRTIEYLLGTGRLFIGVRDVAIRIAL